MKHLYRVRSTQGQNIKEHNQMSIMNIIFNQNFFVLISNKSI